MKLAYDIRLKAGNGRQNKNYIFSTNSCERKTRQNIFNNISVCFKFVCECICVFASVLCIILKQLKQISFDTRFIFRRSTGRVLFRCVVLDAVGKSTVAETENFGKNGKSNRREDFIRASAGEIRNNSDGSLRFLAAVVSKLTMVSKEGKTQIFSQFH